MDILAQRAAGQQKQAEALWSPDGAPQQEQAPPIYGPGGTERPRLLTDIVTAVAASGTPPEDITKQAQALIEWIDAHD